MTTLKQNIAFITLALLAGCQAETQSPSPKLAAYAVITEQGTNTGWAVPGSQKFITVSEQTGIKLKTEKVTEDSLPGAFKQISLRSRSPEHWLFATIDANNDQVVIGELLMTEKSLRSIKRLDHSALLADSICLFEDAANGTLSLFVQDGRGRAEQWLLSQQGQPEFSPRLMRTLAQPHDVNSCVVDDANGHLYVNEEALGIWRYHARVEDEPSREPLALIAPHGKLPTAVKSLAMADSGELFALSESGNQLHRWKKPGISHTFETLKLNGADFESVTISRLPQNGSGNLTFANEESGALFTATISLSEPKSRYNNLPVVQADVETEVADRFGDAMDDPAIWVHPTDHSQSRVLGTHKKRGLEVYDLSGKLLQRFEDGKLNNVDLRDGFPYGNQQISLAAASKRNDDSLMFYGISDDGQVHRLGSVLVDVAPIYGLCMGQFDGKTFVFANDKQGNVKQFQVEWSQQQMTAKLIAQFKLDSQPEGCVVDDKRKRLFVGEEDRGVWAAELSATGTMAPRLIAEVGGVLIDDVEGLALSADPDPILVVSSQGNNSYQLYSAQPPYTHLGGFRIGLNAETGVDGASETDGLELSTRLSTPDYPQGLLVVQDGRNRMPDQPQNFKYVSWKKVLNALRLTPASAPLQ